MKSRLIVTAALSLLAAMPCIAQTLRLTRASEPAQPPPLPLQAFVNTSQPDGVLTRVVEFQPAVPLGPVDVLKAYEDGKTLIAQRLSAELVSISQAHQANQITRDQAEYLIQDRYQVAMMQHEVLSALHDGLERDLVQAAKHPDSIINPGTVLVVRPPSSVQPQTH